MRTEPPGKVRNVQESLFAEYMYKSYTKRREGYACICQCMYIIALRRQGVILQGLVRDEDEPKQRFETMRSG